MTRRNGDLRQAFVFGNAALDEVFLVRDMPSANESVLGRAGYTGLGGKGANQAIALARTGLQTTLVAAIGADWQGRAIRESLSREPLEAALIEFPGLPTDRSIIFVQENGGNVIVTTNECAGRTSIAECLSVLDQSRRGDAMLVQGNLRIDVTSALCHECRRRGMFIVLNPSPFDTAFKDLLPLIDALFVNETEARSLTGLSRRDAVMALLRSGATQVVLTMGSEGSLLASQHQAVHVPAVPADVVDVTGAGDCFEGVAVGSALLRGCPIDETAIRHASSAAAFAVERLGAASAFPSPEQIARPLGP